MADITPSHNLPYPEGADDAVPHADLQALAEKLDTELDDIAPGQITGVAAGRLLIANASGVVTGTAITGDITVNSSGVAEIGAGKVGTPELGANAVTTAKIDNGAVARNKVGTWIQAGSVSASGASGSATITWSTPFSGTAYSAVITAVGHALGGPIAPRLGIREQTAEGIGVSWADAPPNMVIRAIAISG